VSKLFDQFEIPLGFGGASISGEGGGYGFGDVSEEQANDTLAAAFDAGIRLYDTAPIYGFGLSEKRLGQYFKSKRDEIFYISKSGVDWHDTKRVNMTNDPKVTHKMLEQSLRDLQSDYIDLYMIHWPDQNVDIRKPLEVLAKAKLKGKIKHIGLCNTYMEDLKKAQEIDKIEAVQSQLNPFDTTTVEQLGEYLNEQNISFMSWGTLDKGILTRKVTQERKYDDSDCRSWAPWWDKKEVAQKSIAMQKVFDFLEQNDANGLDFAISHNLHVPVCDMVLVGMKNPKYVESTVSSVSKLIDEKIVAEAKEILLKELEAQKG
jgi:myo-inositol catabolism protein IolS